MNLILNIILLAIETALIVFFSENTIFYKKWKVSNALAGFFTVIAVVESVAIVIEILIRIVG